MMGHPDLSGLLWLPMLLVTKSAEWRALSGMIRASAWSNDSKPQSL
jgi:hypothetical protein